ncbi:MAG: DUF6390 family protein [Acidimicrobiales bacterium]
MSLDTAGPGKGELAFARFAYPPSALGLCGPEGAESLLERSSIVAESDPGGRESDPGGRSVRELARGFEAAWPYLELIAAANEIADPLDERVVEAYWIGNHLLDSVAASALGDFLDRRLGLGVTPGARPVGEVVHSRARPHHNFHVFSVYPWVALLRSSRSPEPLRILEKCRIRWGQVAEVEGDQLRVLSQALCWTGTSLELGLVRSETVAWHKESYAPEAAPIQGAWVAMHWDWACDLLESDQVGELCERTVSELAVVNDITGRRSGRAAAAGHGAAAP